LGEKQKPQVEKRNLGHPKAFFRMKARPLAAVKLFMEMWNKDK
jgi:hypothetical protein